MQSTEKGEAEGKLLEPGDMFGDYTVEKLLGKGGMGAVYLVRAPGGERYAVKVMFPDMVKKGSDYRKRFAREAEFAMKIRHDNLISVYDVGEDPETGLCYIIMDYVPGGSVADRLEREGPLPMSDAVAIAAQVAMALEVAHRYGVIHRDIKPDNIMFDADGTPKLADLGVAKFTDGAHKTTMTTTGMIIGTPAYMAPEQMMDSHHIDARADIYALGVVLYEMLTGKRPNADSTAVELLAKAIKGEPLPDVRTMRPEVSAAIAHVLSLMCAPKPEGRPATALAAAQLLQKAATGRLVLPKKPPRAADAADWKTRRKIPLYAICAAAGIVLCASIAAIFSRRASKEERPSPLSVVTTNVVERTIVVTNVVNRIAGAPAVAVDVSSAIEPPAAAPPAVAGSPAASESAHDVKVAPVEKQDEQAPLPLVLPENTSPVELRGSHGLVIKAMPGCRTAAEKLLSDIEKDWLPAALKFYGDPYQGKKPEQAFVMTLERGKSYAYRPGMNEWKGYLPSDRNEFSISLDYLCSAILTRVSEPSWTDFAFYVNRFLSDAVRGGGTAEEKIRYDIKIGKEAEGKARDDYSSPGESQWAAQMKRRWKMWSAFEEVRAKDQDFIIKYCTLKNKRHAEGKINDKITWRQMAEMMGEAVGFDVVEIFTRNGVDMTQANARSTVSKRETDRRVRYETVGEYTWFYTIENGDAVIWRGQNGYNNQTRPAIEPIPRGEVVVPAALGGRQVKAIGSLAFFRCKGMRAVTIPQGVSELRGWAFYGCTGLRSVKLPSGIQTMGHHVFDYCSDLSSIDLGDCMNFRGNSFGNCPSLSRVTVSPANGRYVEAAGAIFTTDRRELVFYPRTRKLLTVPQSVVTIGEGACEGCVLL